VLPLKSCGTVKGRREFPFGLIAILVCSIIPLLPVLVRSGEVFGGFFPSRNFLIQTTFLFVVSKRLKQDSKPNLLDLLDTRKIF
jgi:hypothetical protein